MLYRWFPYMPRSRTQSPKMRSSTEVNEALFFSPTVPLLMILTKTNQHSLKNIFLKTKAHVTLLCRINSKRGISGSVEWVVRWNEWFRRMNDVIWYLFCPPNASEDIMFTLNLLLVLLLKWNRAEAFFVVNYHICREKILEVNIKIWSENSRHAAPNPGQQSLGEAL